MTPEESSPTYSTHSNEERVVERMRVEGQIVRVEDGVVEKIDGATPDKPEIAYLVPVLGAGSNPNGETWRVARVFDASGPAVRPERDAAVRMANGIRDGSMKKALTFINVSRDSSGIEDEKSSPTNEIQEIVSLRDKERSKEEDTTSIFGESFRKDAIRLCGGYVPSILQARSLLRVGREVGVVHLRGSNLLVGLYPSIIPHHLDGEIAEVLVDPVEDECEQQAQAAEVENENNVRALPRSRALSRAQPSERTMRRAEEVDRDVRVAVWKLFDQMRLRLTSKENRFGDLIIHGRVPPFGFVGVVYTAPNENSSIRTVGVVIQTPRMKSRSSRRVACVQFVANGETNETISKDNIVVSCSCSKNVGALSCEHIDLCRPSLPLAHSILITKPTAFRSPLDQEWRCFLLRPRETNKAAIWLSVRDGNGACVNDDFYVPVVEVRDQKHLHTSLRNRMKCMQCRRAAVNRGLCVHEKSAVIAGLSMDKSAELEEKAQNDVEERDRIQFEADAEEESENEAEMHDSDAEKISYVATLPRRIMPCESDYMATADLLFGVAGAKVAEARNNDTNAPDGSDKENDTNMYVVYDTIRQCNNCGFLLRCTKEGRNCSVRKRRVRIHTLLHGTVGAIVADLVCRSCKQTTIFDGRDSALFGWSASVVYSRELLDFWLYQIAMLGGTFRAAYELSTTISATAGSMYSRLGQLLSSRRRQASDVFSAFLSTLEYAGDDNLVDLFSCAECEERRADGTIVMKGVVLDGTATGILGNLPSFHRPSLVLEPAKETAKQQFVFAIPRLRSFFDDLFRAAMANASNKFFSVRSPDSRAADSVERILFPKGDSVRAEEMVAVRELVFLAYKKDSIAQIVRGCRRRRSESTTEPDDEVEQKGNLSTIIESVGVGNSRRGRGRGRGFGARGRRRRRTEDDGKAVNAPEVEHILDDVALRRALAEFAWCITTASVPSVVLTSKKKEEAASKLANEFDLFRWCAHNRMETQVPCASCSRTLRQRSAEFTNLIPTAVCLAKVLSEHCNRSYNTPVRRISYIATVLLRRTVAVNHTFKVRFEGKQAVSSKMYSVLYRYPAGSASLDFITHSNSNVDSTSNADCGTVANSEAAKCGELYPGRPLVRPRVRFKNGSGGEGWSSECSKDYRHHASHSPGLFTLQCVCSRPKLLGVAVMDESESVSTALSSLLSRFPVIPRVIFYDNACNFSRSVSLRLPWFMNETEVFSDRFHYKSHRCCSLFDPDTFAMCDELVTSNAEALNRRWAASRNHIRYLSGKNLVPFLYARSIFLNLRARVREMLQVEDVEDIDMNFLLDRLMPCKCARCLGKESEV